MKPIVFLHYKCKFRGVTHCQATWAWAVLIKWLNRTASYSYSVIATSQNNYKNLVFLLMKLDE